MNLPKAIPATIDEAVDLLFNNLYEEDIEFIKTNDRYCVHHGIGRDIRNQWKLWEESSPLVKDFKNKYNLFGHADDVSGIILMGLWAKVLGLDIQEEINKQIMAYKKHWEHCSVDLETGEAKYKD